jgi:hypothetical protein
MFSQTNKDKMKAEIWWFRNKEDLEAWMEEQKYRELTLENSRKTG